MEIQQDGGSIKIDKLDISKIELEVLRRNITMIPQDPTLFAGRCATVLILETVYR